MSDFFHCIVLKKLDFKSKPYISAQCARWSKMARLYQGVDRIKAKYGKHTLFLGSSFYAHRTAQHEGERGMLPERKQNLLRGESARKRLGLPMLMDEVS